MSIIFRDPPPETRRTRGAAQAFVDALQANPQRWAVYSEGMTQKAATGFVSRNRRRFPQVDWRATPETDGTWSVYGYYRFG
jgi:hypothetical protein